KRRRGLRIAALALLVVVIAVWISVRKAVDPVTTNVSERLSDLQIPPVDREAVKLDGDLMTLVTKVSLASAARMAIPCDEKADEISKAANASSPRCPEKPTDAVFQRHDRADHTSLTL